MTVSREETHRQGDAIASTPEACTTRKAGEVLSGAVVSLAGPGHDVGSRQYGREKLSIVLSMPAFTIGKAAGGGCSAQRRDLELVTESVRCVVR
jgi:hypothetical protein